MNSVKFFYSKAFKSYNRLKSEFLNWWCRYTVGPGEPKVGQIIIHEHHYKCVKFHHFPMFHSQGCHRLQLGENQITDGP